MPKRRQLYQNHKTGMIISLVDDDGAPFGDHDFTNLIHIQAVPRQSWQSYWSARLNIPDAETAALLFQTLMNSAQHNQQDPMMITAIWQKYITDHTNLEYAISLYAPKEATK